MFHWWTSAPNSVRRDSAMNRPSPRMAAGAALLSVLLVTAPGGAESLFDTAGYRVREFRAPTGLEPPPGAGVIDTRALAMLVDSGRVVPVDVLPTPPRPATLPPDALWLPQPRYDIPGSVWLPDLGQPALSAPAEARFRAVVDAAMAERPGALIVAYCLADCWLSWNAARRMASWGIAAVRWYPEGTDGWTAAGHAVDRATPAVSPGDHPAEPEPEPGRR